MIPQIISALSQLASPWAILTFSALAAAAYSAKKMADTLLGWPRPAELERAHEVNDKLRAKLEEASDEIEEREATIRQQSEKIFQLEYEEQAP